MAYNSTYPALFQTPQGLWVDCTIKGTDNVSSHFDWYEIWNEKCSAKVKMKMYCNDQYDSWVAIDCLEYCRDDYGQPITIGDKKGKGGSGYREEAYNKSVGGVSNSLHLYTCAFDLQLGPISDAEYLKWYHRVELACYIFAKNGVPLQAELGRYEWGLHVGWCYKLPYNFNGRIYTFDKR